MQLPVIIVGTGDFHIVFRRSRWSPAYGGHDRTASRQLSVVGNFSSVDFYIIRYPHFTEPRVSRCVIDLDLAAEGESWKTMLVAMREELRTTALKPETDKELKAYCLLAYNFNT